MNDWKKTPKPPKGYRIIRRIDERTLHISSKLEKIPEISEEESKNHPPPTITIKNYKRGDKITL